MGIKTKDDYEVRAIYQTSNKTYKLDVDKTSDSYNLQFKAGDIPEVKGTNGVVKTAVIDNETAAEIPEESFLYANYTKNIFGVNGLPASFSDVNEFTRLTAATNFIEGELVEYAAGQPRLEAGKGLLIEPQSTNRLYPSNKVEWLNYTPPSTTVRMDSVGQALGVPISALECVEPGLLRAATHLNYSNGLVPATISAVVKAEGGGRIFLAFSRVSGLAGGVYFDPATEELEVISGDRISDYGFERLSEGFYRIWATRIPAPTETAVGWVHYTIGLTDANVGDRLLVTLMGSVDDPAPTSPIPTSNSQVTRSPDLLRLTIPAGKTLSIDADDGIIHGMETPTTALIYADKPAYLRKFKVEDRHPAHIPIPNLTPKKFGDPLEGGFYTGMIWNRIALSNNSKALATGDVTFTLDRNGPLVYLGQMIEVRSVSNPANKFIGKVKYADFGTITLGVTKVEGTGTFNDWAIMSRFRVIVSPKSQGESGLRMLKFEDTAMPAATQTLTEGWESTNAMFNAGTAAEYPAAHFARSLNINGYTDWYIPARDELELAWRNLKSTTIDNTVGSRYRPLINYQKDGAYSDDVAMFGVNLNSSPQSPAYTLTDPAQTSSTAFRTGGSEEFAWDTFFWSSSEAGPEWAWVQYWVTAYRGNQLHTAKTTMRRVRAVRRSII